MKTKQEDNFLIVNLNDINSKKVAETITNSTSRKIMNHLTQKEDTEANIAKHLNIPISTVHYHLQKLKETNLIIAKEFHYSQKGREINHYKLTNKHIIITSSYTPGLRDKLKAVLPVGLIVLGVSALVHFVTKMINNVATFGASVPNEAKMLATEIVEDAMIEEAMAAPRAFAEPVAQTISQEPNFALWFLAGGIVTIMIYLIYIIIKEKIDNKNKK